MGWTQTDAALYRTVTRGLNPRTAGDRPTAQDVFDALVALADKAAKAVHGKPGTVRESERDSLRLLVDDLYRTDEWRVVAVDPRTVRREVVNGPVDEVSARALLKVARRFDPQARLERRIRATDWVRYEEAYA